MQISASSSQLNAQPGACGNSQQGLAFVKIYGVLAMALAIGGTNRELCPGRIWGPRVPQRSARIFPILAQCVKAQVDRLQALPIIVKVSSNTFQCVEHSLFRRHPLPHVLDDGMRSADSQVLFSAPRGPGAADILIQPQAAADDGRISQAAGDLPGQAAGGGN